MTAHPDFSGYLYENAELNSSHSYLLPAVIKMLDSMHHSDSKRLFELGCGNGAVAASLVARGYSVVGIDASVEGIAHANRKYPHIQLHSGSAYDDLASKYGTFPTVVSLEVVEHLYAPRKYAKSLFDLLQPDGVAIISTPYHGYLKNLVLALTGKMDAHFTALLDHGHIKFWSKRTLSTLLLEAGFSSVTFELAGRVPPLAKSMIALAKR